MAGLSSPHLQYIAKANKSSSYTVVNTIAGVHSVDPKTICLPTAGGNRETVASSAHHESVAGLMVKFGKLNIDVEPPELQLFWEVLSEIDAIGYEAERQNDQALLTLAKALLSRLQGMILLDASAEATALWNQLDYDIWATTTKNNVGHTVKLMSDGDFPGCLGKYRQDDTALLITASPELRSWVDLDPKRRLYCTVGQSQDLSQTTVVVHMTE